MNQLEKYDQLAMTTREGTMDSTQLISPNHKDILLMSLVIEKQDLNNLKEKQRQEHKQRMKEIIEKHKIELEEAICLKNERHNSMMKELDEQLLVETNSLMLYEAKHIQNDNWVIVNDECEEINQKGLRELSGVLSRARIMLDHDKEEAVRNEREKQKEITNVKIENLKRKHEEHLEHFNLMWSDKVKEHWEEIRKSKEKEHSKKLSKRQQTLQDELTNAVDSLKSKLQPMLDHKKQQWRKIHDDNTMLEETIKSLKIKELAARIHMQKLQTSFKDFIATTTGLDDEKCEGLMKNQISQVNSLSG